MDQALPFQSVPPPIPAKKDLSEQKTPENLIRKALREESLAKYLGSDPRILGTSLLIFLMLILFTYPKYLELLVQPNLKANYSYFFEKLESPLTAAIGDGDSHGGKIDFRLTVPLLAKMIGINDDNAKSVVFIFLLQSAMLVPFLFVFIKLLLRYLPAASVLFIVIGSSSVYLCKAFIWDYDFWFDGFAYLFLLLGMYLLNRPAIFVTLTLACWTDERAVVALSSVYLFHLLAENNFSISSWRQFLATNRLAQQKSTTVLLVALMYLAGRLFLSTQFGLHTPTGEGSGVALSLIPYQLKHRLAGIFLSFEGFWALFLVAVGLLLRRGDTLVASLMAAFMVVHILVAYSVYDISRSITYAFPLIITAAVLIYKQGFPNTRYLYLGASILCMLLPTQYLIFYPRQIPWTILSFDELRPIVHELLRM